jgi:hypothetical protein
MELKAMLRIQQLLVEPSTGKGLQQGVSPSLPILARSPTIELFIIQLP